MIFPPDPIPPERDDPVWDVGVVLLAGGGEFLLGADSFLQESAAEVARQVSFGLMALAFSRFAGLRLRRERNWLPRRRRTPFPTRQERIGRSLLASGWLASCVPLLTNTGTASVVAYAGLSALIFGVVVLTRLR